MVYSAGELNLANYLSSIPKAIIQPDHFRPPQLRYISYDIKSNDFKLLLDKGDAKQPNEKSLTPELLNYFLIGLSLPNDTFWVNLRPDAADNIIDPLLEKTDIGRIFLEADLQLKKDTASLTSPQNPEGKAYWDKLYKKAGELFGSENITIPTITRPWIVPNEVIVRETDDSAYIYKATLKVMLEQDHLKDSATYNFSDPRLKELNEYSSQLIRETIIPKLTQEVNSSKRYAKLRQVYYSLVLSRWFKQKYSGFGSAGAPEHKSTSMPVNNYISLIDSGNLVNLASKEPCDKQAYFQAYQKSFKGGEYNLKETVATPFGQSIRSYVSGGISAVGSPIIPGGFTTTNKPVTTQLVSDIQPAAVGSPVTVDEKYINKFRDDIYSLIVGEDINNYFLKDRKKVEEAIEKISKDFTDIKGNKDIDKFKSLIAYTLETFSPFIGTDKLYDGVMHHAVLRLQVLSLDIEKVYGPLEKPKGSAGSPLDRTNELKRNIAERKNRIIQILNEISVNEKKINDLSAQLLNPQLFKFSTLKDEKQELKEQNERNYAAIDRIYEHINKMSSELKELGEITELSGSPVTGVSSAIGSEDIVPEVKRGGLDFTDRAMRIKLERVGSFADLKMMLPGINNVEAIDLDNELRQIQAMVSSSIRPSDTRILEFAAACYYKGEFDQRLEQVSSCVKAAHLADERLGKDSSDTLRLATILPDALYAYGVN